MDKEKFDPGEELLKLEGSQSGEDKTPTEDIKTLIDSSTSYPSILKALCNIPWEGVREEWINYLVEKKGNIDKRAVRRDIKQFFKQSIVETKEETEEEVTEEDKTRAFELLKSPGLLDNFLKTTSKIGLVREKVNKLCLYLAYTSRLLEEPISIIVLGQSSSGKSHITNGVLRFFPRTTYLSYSSITAQSLYYLKDKELKHKVLAIFERAGSERADYSIRTFISEKELKILYVTKDPRTGEMVSKDLVKEGPISFVETSSDPKIHTDNLTRVFALYVEENPEKVKAVLEETAKGYSQKRPEGIEEELRVWQCLQTLLTPYKVKIPYAGLLVEYFPTDTVRVQRDFKRFLALVEASCLLHQYQREKDEGCLMATIEDYQVAYEIGKTVLSQTLKEISPKAEDLLEAIKKLKEEKEEDSFSFIRKDVEEHTGWEARQINRHLKELTTRGYCSILAGGKGKPYTYSIEGNVQIRISLPSPEELKDKILIGLSNCPTPTKTLVNKGIRPGQGSLSNLCQPVQPTLDLDNLDRHGQMEFVQLRTAPDKDSHEGWTPGQEGEQDIIEVEEVLA